MILRYDGRKLEVELQFEEAPEDTMVVSGVDLDTGNQLTDDELDEITANTDFYEEWRDHKIMQAETWAEIDR